MALSEPLMTSEGQLTKSGKARFCALCDSRFTKNVMKFNPRHHCRDCNKTVCGRCSKEKNASGLRICYKCKNAGGTESSGFAGEEEFNHTKSGRNARSCSSSISSSGISDGSLDGSSHSIGPSSPQTEEEFPGADDFLRTKTGSKSSRGGGAKKKSDSVLGISSEKMPGEDEFRKGSTSGGDPGSQVVLTIHSDSLDCMACRRKFTTLRRKHHCRACNRVICSGCWTDKICSICQGGKGTTLGVQVEFEQGAAKCNVCKADFNWKRKKHHCRKCGKTICDSCSKNTQKIHPADVVASRVCDNCHINSQSCSCCRMSKKHRLIGFWSCFLMGVALILGSAFDVGSLVGKNLNIFGAVYGTGNALVLLSTLFLWGPRVQAARICDIRRGMTPFVLYFGALGATVGLIVGFKNPAPMFIIICMCVQLLAIVWYCLTLFRCCERKTPAAST